MSTGIDDFVAAASSCATSVLVAAPSSRASSVIQCDTRPVHTSLLLTGPSGVGKSTVAGVLQARLSEGWLFYEVDRCSPRHPPFASFATPENDRALTRATLAAAAVYVAHGFRVILEIDVATPGRLPLVRETLGDIPVVLLTCSESTMRTRAHGRGQGAVDPRWALNHWRQGMWDKLVADLVVGTDNRSADEVAGEVADFLVRT